MSMEAEKFLTPDEFARLLKAAKDDREKCLLLLLAGAGLRIGEMVAVRAEDIDFRKAYLHIRSANAKLKKARTVVLLPPVIESLQKHLAGRSEGWLFPGYSGEHISARQVQKIIDRVADRSKLQRVENPDRQGPGRYRIHPHLLRHSFAMWSLDNGVPIYDLQRQLGHASLAATGIYLEASPNHRREAYLRSGVSDCLAGKKS
jgi:integrase/recombinase XerD